MISITCSKWCIECDCGWRIDTVVGGFKEEVLKRANEHNRKKHHNKLAIDWTY